jgi:hypothetical protein
MFGGQRLQRHYRGLCVGDNGSKGRMDKGRNGSGSKGTLEG